jgi:amino-acid N-acetyltransferase
MTQAASSPKSSLASGARLRKARTADVLAMQRMINAFADRGAMLHRSLSELYENIRDFSVIEEAGEVVGCAALHVSWRGLAELKSLAVAEHVQRKGYGKRLILACLEEADALGLEQVFALTYVPELFVRQGFRVVEKAVLPRKVWTECIYCPKFPDCGEVAVLKSIGTQENTGPDNLFFPLELTPRTPPTRNE